MVFLQTFFLKKFMSQIDDQIWIGNSSNAHDQQFFKDRGITHILCCAEELKFRPGFVEASRWHHLPIVDNIADEAEELFREGAALLKKWLNEGHKIMVHCFGGVSRSVSVVIAYYILYKGWSYDIAYSHCRQRRPYADPHDDFVPILRRMQTLEQALESAQQ